MNRRELNHVILGGVLVLLGLATFGLIFGEDHVRGLDQWPQLDLYRDYHHVPPQPRLAVNHAVGKPGSFVLITGREFPVYNNSIVTVNGRLLGTVYVDGEGKLEFELSTDTAQEGAYYVTVTVSSSATTKFTLDANSPNTWPSVGSSTTFEVPAGIALTEFVYVPIVLR